MTFLRWKKMEFEGLKQFFVSQLYMKKKYPAISSYNKYLTTLTTEESQFKEVDCFKRFLVQNQRLHENTFDFPEFKTGKKHIIINMLNFLDHKTQVPVSETFWKELSDLEIIMFPKGKTTDNSHDIAESSGQSSGLQIALSSLESNPLFKGVIDQIKSSVINMEDVTLETIMSSPDFIKTVNNLKMGVINGTYKLKDLTKVVDDIATVIHDETDPENREILQTLTSSIRAVERGETPDMSKIMGIVSKFKLNHE